MVLYKHTLRKTREIDMEREYTYAKEAREYSYEELIRMTKKRVIRIAGYKNIKSMYKDGIGRRMTQAGFVQDNLSKKYIARLIAKDILNGLQ